MAILHPFRALRPTAEAAPAVACVPYDVINTDEARQLAAGNAQSFLHVIRPEIDLPLGMDEHEAVVYETGAANLKAFAASSFFIQEEMPALYIYRLIMNGRTQTGIYGCVAVADYDSGVILKHELTRQDKEDDRTRHLLMQEAHAEPVMLTFRGTAGILAEMERAMEAAPLYDFTAPDGIQHTIWKVVQTDDLVAGFAEVPKLYVADGHHRCKAASRAVEAMKPSDPVAEMNFFPAVLFPMDQMAILPYNRIVYRLPNGVAGFLEALQARFEVRIDAPKSPEKAGEVSFYVDGKWYGICLPEAEKATVADALDVSRLAAFVLEPMLGITDPRTDKNLFFVGGIRGTAELERLVDDGTAELAISMYPTQIEELLAVSDAGLLMPPKSTWFEPKLRSGLLVHLF